MRVGLHMKMTVAVNAMRELMPRVVRIPKKRRGMSNPAILKKTSNDRAGSGEILRIRFIQRIQICYFPYNYTILILYLVEDKIPRVLRKKKKKVS